MKELGRAKERFFTFRGNRWPAFIRQYLGIEHVTVQVFRHGFAEVDLLGALHILVLLVGHRTTEKLEGADVKVGATAIGDEAVAHRHFGRSLAC